MLAPHRFLDVVEPTIVENQLCVVYEFFQVWVLATLQFLSHSFQICHNVKKIIVLLALERNFLAKNGRRTNPWVVQSHRSNPPRPRVLRVHGMAMRMHGSASPTGGGSLCSAPCSSSRTYRTYCYTITRYIRSATIGYGLHARR